MGRWHLTKKVWCTKIDKLNFNKTNSNDLSPPPSLPSFNNFIPPLPLPWPTEPLFNNFIPPSPPPPPPSFNNFIPPPLPPPPSTNFNPLLRPSFNVSSPQQFDGTMTKTKAKTNP